MVEARRLFEPNVVDEEDEVDVPSDEEDSEEEEE